MSYEVNKRIDMVRVSYSFIEKTTFTTQKKDNEKNTYIYSLTQCRIYFHV